MHYHCIDNPRKLCPICPPTEEDTDVGKDASVDENVNMNEDEDGGDEDEIEVLPDTSSKKRKG